MKPDKWGTPFDLPGAADPQQTEPVGFDTVFSQELRRVFKWRQNRGSSAGPEPGAPSPFEKADKLELFGLSFSGGGIRSATFNLGVLQTLARLKILRHVDYLSTVSGAGTSDRG